MRRLDNGFTLIEILVVITILAVLAGLVVPLIGTGQREGQKVQCINNMRNLVGILESGPRYPQESGPALLLYLVKRGALAGEDELRMLFCPGDRHETFEATGGVEAYADLDLTRKGEHGHLTSYAGRDQARPECRVTKGGPGAILIADDSEDHHHGLGFVAGLTGGAIVFRDKVDRWKIDRATPVTLGEGSAVEELRCLAGD